MFEFIFPQGHCKVKVYRTYCDKEKIVPSSKEFQWYGWMKTNEIDRELLAKDLLCPDTRIAYERFKSEFI